MKNKKYCIGCGALCENSDVNCKNCGEELLTNNVEISDNIQLSNEIVNDKLESYSITKNVSNEFKSNVLSVKDILYLFIGITFLSFIIYFVSTPKEVKGPKQEIVSERDSIDPHSSINKNQGTESKVKATPGQLKLIEDLKKSYLGNPTDSLNLKLANALYDAGMYNEALQQYKNYVYKNSDNLDARTDMAYSMYESGDLEGSLEEHRAIIAKNPKHQIACYQYALLQVVNKNKDSTLYWLKKVVEINPKSVQGTRAAQILSALK